VVPKWHILVLIFHIEKLNMMGHVVNPFKEQNIQDRHD